MRLRRLVAFVGYDGESLELLKRLKLLKNAFSTVSIIYVPDAEEESLRDLSIPSIIVEECVDGVIVRDRHYTLFDDIDVGSCSYSHGNNVLI